MHLRIVTATTILVNSTFPTLSEQLPIQGTHATVKYSALGLGKASL